MEYSHLPPPLLWKMPPGCERRSGGKKVAFPGKVSRGLGTADQPLGLPCVSPILTLMPLLPIGFPTDITLSGMQLVLLPRWGHLHFCCFFLLNAPQTKIYYHSGPLWINDLLSALFIRAWGGNRSLCVWRWGRLELCSS